MRKVHDARGVEFGHEYWTSIDEQLDKWDHEPFEMMTEMDIAEQVAEEQDRREYAYKFIAEHIWNAAHKALEEGNLAESMAIGDVYNQWIEVCVKAGVM